MDMNILPFGAQYYRAPTPVAADFERDLRNFAAQGFNTIKIWLQWRWNSPAEGEYDFSDLETLLSIAGRLGLGVVVNIICDVAPAWLYAKYPDSLMETADGRKLHPQTTASRQIGGAPGPCLHHPQAARERRRFIEAAAEALSGYEALLCWDLWNEPELTCAILREPIQADMVCYCNHSHAAFVHWLERKYGDIEGVNAAWGRNYRCFGELELPRCPHTFQDMIDWRSFFAHTMADEARMRAEAVRLRDPVHPVMLHTVPAPYFNMVNACSDEYLLAGAVDLFGNSLGSSPFSATTATTAARGKRVINAEIHALGGSTFDRPHIPSLDEMKRHIFIPLGRGVTGFLFWQYRPERIGLEGPAWGLTTLNGGETPWLHMAQQINHALQCHADALLRARPEPARIAILNSGEGEVFTWCIAGSTELYHQSVKGLFDIVYGANFPVDIISEHQLTCEGLAPYECLIAPFPYYLRGTQADAIRTWVADGGFLISEALFAGYGAEHNLHETRVPGRGFDEVFGAMEKETLTASRFQNAYRSDGVDRTDGAIELTSGSCAAYGYHFRQALLLDGAKELACFADGDTAAAVHSFGAGRAVMVGTLLGAQYARTHDEGTRAFLCNILEKHLRQQPIAQCPGRVDVLFDGKEPAFCVIQAPKRGGRFTLTSPHIKGRRLTNLMTGGVVEAEGDTVSLEMPDGGIDAFRILKVGEPER